MVALNFEWCEPCNSKHFQNDFNNWASGNDKIDKFIQDTQLNANNYWHAIEWIPFDRFKDVKQIGKGGFGTIHYAGWIDGPIEKWDIENQQWKRDSNCEVALKKFDNFVNFNDVLNEMEIHLKTYTKHNASIQFYGITQDPETLSYMMVLDYANDGNLREYLKINFNNINWKQKLNNLYNLSLRLKNIYKLDIKWDIENQQWKRDSNCEVALKKFDNFVNFNDVLNEMEIHLKTYTKHNASIQFYGITQDPETLSYMMVLDYANDGNLREYLKINFNNINWKQKLNNLYNLSLRLKNIYKLDIVHQDFHPGNILSYDFKDFKGSIYISDFGLSKLIGTNPNNPEKKNIFGVLPYIAPEILSGDEEYTKAADVYSFGIIAYEIVTGFPPYPDIPHDKNLAIKICNGLRPKITFHTPKFISRIIMRYYEDYLEGKNKDSEIVIQIKKAEEFSANQESTNTTTTTTTTPLNYQTHPQAVHTSRLLNYSNFQNPRTKKISKGNLKNYVLYEILHHSISLVCNFDFIKI
ncbi:hypothetical protein Glove_42g53 [Diversispora epigaea]|uniref:Protein kinase domain-containing protein n=1 Tax=Diversispora epigaea TaxID=1348612 RepID=A0A397JNY5_9GLOM|nr:hypothetical protein Glove_42g53 [Diversispora epigaea]